MDAIVSTIVNVHPREIPALLYSSLCFFFVRLFLQIFPFPLRYVDFNYRGCLKCATTDLQLLSAYFLILPLRDEGAISLGLGNLPGLFAGSLLLTLVAAPLSTIIFSTPNISKGRVRRNNFSVLIMQKSENGSTLHCNYRIIFLLIGFQALVLIHRFFSISILLFFVLWHLSSSENLGSSSKVRILIFVKIFAVINL